MDINTRAIKWAEIIVGLALGLLLGYSYGSSFSFNDGIELGIKQGVLEEKTAAIARRKEAEREAAKAINPFQGTANPFEKSPVNPYDNIKINPF